MYLCIWQVILSFYINMKLIIRQWNVLCRKPLLDAIWKMCVGGKWKLLHIGRKGLVFILCVLLIASWISECYCGWNNDIAPLKMLTVMETVAMWCPEWIKNAWHTPFQLTLWFPGWLETSRCLIQPKPMIFFDYYKCNSLTLNRFVCLVGKIHKRNIPRSWLR